MTNGTDAKPRLSTRDFWVVVVLVLGGLGGTVYLGVQRLPVDNIVVAVLMSLAITGALFWFLGGISPEDAIKVMGGKLTGSAAVFVVATMLINHNLPQKIAIRGEFKGLHNHSSAPRAPSDQPKLIQEVSSDRDEFYSRRVEDQPARKYDLEWAFIGTRDLKQLRFLFKQDYEVWRPDRTSEGALPVNLLVGPFSGSSGTRKGSLVMTAILDLSKHKELLKGSKVDLYYRADQQDPETVLGKFIVEAADGTQTELPWDKPTSQLALLDDIAPGRGFLGARAASAQEINLSHIAIGADPSFARSLVYQLTQGEFESRLAAQRYLIRQGPDAVGLIALMLDTGKSEQVDYELLVLSLGQVVDGLSESGTTIPEELYLQLANELTEAGYLEEAQRFYSKLEGGDLDQQAFLGRGNIYLQEGKATEAERLYKKYLEGAKDPEQEVAGLTNLGAAYLEMGDLEQARRQFEEAVSLAPDSANAHTLLGITLLRQGRLNRAREVLSRALELDPENEIIQRNLEEAGGPP